MINLETTIKQFYGTRDIKGALYGIELEYEKARIDDLDRSKTPLTRWRTEHDSSLREGGIEFVSRPLGLGKIGIALDQVLLAAKSIGAVPTPRCGLHVHVNMTDRTFRDLFNSSVLYTILEPVLFREYGEDRQNSHFCVPTYSNTVLAEYLYEDIQLLRKGIFENTNVKAAMSFNPFDFIENTNHGIILKLNNTPKYSALNYSALKKFGTVEYRHHPSTLDKNRIIEWINLINSIHSYAYSFHDPLDIIQLFDSDGLTSLCEKVNLKQSQVVDENDQEDAVDAAILIAGHPPVKWQELKWEVA